MSDLPGNQEVKDLINRFLPALNAGEIDYTVVIFHSARNEIVGGYAGNSMVEPAILEAMKKGVEAIQGSIDEKKLPDRDPNLDSSHVCYNLLYGPCSFDFTTWLVAQEMKRIRDGAPAPLKVYFHGEGKGLEGDKNRHQMFYNVMKPAVQLLGAVESEDAKLGQFVEYFGPRPITEATRKGEEVPSFHAPEDVQKQVTDYLQANGYTKPPVVLTLREMDRWSFRNSNLNEWLKFANWLEKQGEQVLFVRDTAKASETIAGFKTYPLASLDLAIRCALYEQARANLFTNNGPAILAFCGNKPLFIIQTMLPKEHLYAPNTPNYWDEHVGMKEGEQYPWLKAHQRLIWGTDDFDTLKKGWETIWQSDVAVKDEKPLLETPLTDPQE